MSYIAERILILEDIQSGEKRNLTIRIGLPTWDENKEFASCPVEYEGLFKSFADVRGMDILHALELASNIDLVLRGYINKYRFYWLDGELYDVDDHLKDQINILEQARSC